MRRQLILSGLAVVTAIALCGHTLADAARPVAARGHFNVGSTHSPLTERGLADVRQSPGRGAVLGVDVASGNHPGGARRSRSNGKSSPGRWPTDPGANWRLP